MASTTTSSACLTCVPRLAVSGVVAAPSPSLARASTRRRASIPAGGSGGSRVCLGRRRTRHCCRRSYHAAAATTSQQQQEELELTEENVARCLLDARTEEIVEVDIEDESQLDDSAANF
eukprot:jgi/Chlat1/6381/Chrsp44S05843